MIEDRAEEQPRRTSMRLSLNSDPAEIDKSLQKLEFIFKRKESHFFEKMADFKKEYEDFNLKNKVLKDKYNSIVKQQTRYYLNILKDGIDVRGEGLVWVVKRLKELSCEFESYMFPRYLDGYQIDYLQKLAEMMNERSQLNVVLGSFKLRQKRAKERRQAKVFNRKMTTKEDATNSNYFQSTAGATTSEGGFYRSKLLDKLDHNFLNFNDESQNKEKEEKNITRIIKEIRQVMHNDQTEKLMATEPNSNPYLYLLLENTEDREMFSEILFLRKKIETCESQIEGFISEFKKLFRKKFDAVKNLNYKFTIQYDIIYSALFGNGITV